VNVREAGADIYAFSGHKLYGPTGVGVLYGRRELLERMPPFLGGGDMVDKVSFEKTTWAALPYKFEAGTTNYVGAVGLAEAIKYLQEFDPDDVEKHERALLDVAMDELSQIEGLRVYGTARDKAPIVAFTVEGTHPSDMGAILDKQGIAIRTGTHCAQPLMARFGVETMCRASFAIYNTPGEVAALAAGVKKAVMMLRR
jgi:cysteine desulfurase/selenocysteine lyase